MNTYAPDYYKQFKCIANQCKHSCCIGWEIEIDENTLSTYKTVQGSFGKRLSENITDSDGIPIFKLDTNERCPFLNKNNLCDIIINLGENQLCQICTDHPRFRNFYTNLTEIGLGLACEAAAELILNNENITTIVLISDKDSSSQLTENELYFFELRNKIFEIVQNRSQSFIQRLHELSEVSQIITPSLTARDWASELLKLEQLSSEWTSFLQFAVQNKSISNSSINDLQLEQLLVYFLFRHTTPERITDGIRFALIATEIIIKLSPYSDNFINLCRMFSSEIEYSEENLQYIINF